MAAISQSKADIIFLSDTRIVSSKGISSSQRIRNSLRDNNGRKYDIIFNSTGNSRGVAILVSNMINEFQIISEYKDACENYYLLECTINDSNYCLGAIYGPNNTSRTFFTDLTRVIAEIRARGTNYIVIWW
jgi:hypothetical protein